MLDVKVDKFKFQDNFKISIAKCKIDENAMKQLFSLLLQYKAFAIIFLGNKV